MAASIISRSKFLHTHSFFRPSNVSTLRHFTSSSSKLSKKKEKEDDIWMNSFVGHTFPDFIEGWNRQLYRKVGYCKKRTIYIPGHLSLLMLVIHNQSLNVYVVTLHFHYFIKQVSQHQAR